MNKKIYAILIAVVFTASVQAQFTLGVRAGVNLTNFSQLDEEGKELGKDYKSESKLGFQIGLVGDYAVSENFSIQPGVIFAQQGAKYSDDDSDAKIVFNLNYLQVPINAQYKLLFGERLALTLQAGPYVGYGLNGKMKFWGEDGKKISDSDLNEGLTGDEKDWFKIKFGSDKEKDNMKAFDFGVGFGAGLQFGNAHLGLGYNLGLMNIAHSDGKSSTKNNGLVFTLTYLFGGNK
jgi:hypothetical protein